MFNDPIFPVRSNFCALTKPQDEVWPWDMKRVLDANNADGKNLKITKMDSERALLCYFVAQVGKIDPDIIIGEQYLKYN